MDFAVLLPALISLGPWGIVGGVYLYLEYRHGQELDKRDATIEARDTRISAIQEARLVDHKSMLEARISDNREMQRVVSEATGTNVRVSDALKTMAETTADIANTWHVEREVARREAERGRTA